MGRLQEFMKKTEREEELSSSDSLMREAILDQQKQVDLLRAQARSVARPIKKELRHSQIEGRYIRPEEVKKEIEKLEQAKQKAEEKKKGLFRRLFGRKKTKASPESNAESTTDQVISEQTADKSEKDKEEKKKKAKLIQRLRGIASARKARNSQEAEQRYLSVNGLEMPDSDDFIPQEDGFIEEESDIPPETENEVPFAQNDSSFDEQGQYGDRSDVDEAELSRRLFAPLPADRPDGIIATALSVAVGFVYWDEEDQKVDRVITIRKLFYRQGDILIDAFCHDIAAPRLIVFSRGIKMYNLQTMKTYDNPRDFVMHHLTGLSENGDFRASGFTAALSVVRYELAALVYVAKSDFDRSDEENRLMLSYISQRCPTIDFDENKMLDYIAMLVPDEQSFSEALGIVIKQPQDIVLLFARTFLQMMLSDGVLHENERELLAELLYLLQTEGIELSRLGLG